MTINEAMTELREYNHLKDHRARAEMALMAEVARLRKAVDGLWDLANMDGRKAREELDEAVSGQNYSQAAIFQCQVGMMNYFMAKIEQADAPEEPTK